MKTVSAGSKIVGRRIHFVLDTENGFQKYPCQTRVPPSSKLMNFELEFGGDLKNPLKARSILCLDNYGNEIMTEELHKSILRNVGWFDCLLGIDRQTFELYVVSFMTEKGKLGAVFSPLVQCSSVALKVPKPYQSRIDELKSAKRPWFVTLPDRALFEFQDRYIGTKDLENEIIVDLDFRPYRLQVSSDSWREISNWNRD